MSRELPNSLLMFIAARCGTTGPARTSTATPTTSGRHHGVGDRRARPQVAAEREPQGVRLTRITLDPAVMAGVPTLRKPRIPVATVVAMVADGITTEAIPAELPDLEAEDVAEALRYAAEELRERHLPLRPSA